ncbi:MAG: hypothetical protein GX628_02725 [Clostridiales bacterium]|nr:hypothetical protein [Clostridiales bacterium]
MTEYLCTLKNPGKEYRGLPFWSWNDRLTPDECRRQIALMDEAGLGGYFMHARGGLETEYLGEEWFECIKACIDEGKKRGMYSWSYDEEGWPSGFAGGIVSGMGDYYHVRNLAYGEITGAPQAIKGTIIGYYTVSPAGHYSFSEDLDSAKEFTNEKIGDKLYYVCHQSNQYYVDILNPKVVRAFIDCTYERYKKELGEDFGGTSMPGFFTDEPQYARSKVPWSYILPEEFCNTNGYLPEEHLICLFLDVLGYQKFRYDFYRVVSRLYTESFGKQIYDWCCENNCKFTGHAMMEDSLYCQLACTAGVMPLYEYMHMPGMDWLGRHIASPIIPKQVSSVSRQLGKKMSLSETYALCGWDCSYEELKWIGEWQFVNGINILCQHLEGYTIRGLRKRDYSSPVTFQAPEWSDYKQFNDYFSRLGKLFADNDVVADVLVLHPLHSGWMAYDSGNCAAIQKLDRSFVETSNLLSGLHIGYDYGDETIMAVHGRVEDGKLIIGKCAYSAVVLPSIDTLDESTYILLTEFIAQGGKIYANGDLPSRINGRTDARLKNIITAAVRIPADRELVLNFFVNEGLKKVTVSGRDGEAERIHARVCNMDDGKAWFFVNLDKDRAYDVKITLSEAGGGIVEYSLETLGASMPDTLVRDGERVIFAHFEPMQSRLFLTGGDLPMITVKEKPGAVLPLARGWDIDLANSDPNLFTIDYVSYSKDGVEFTQPKPVLGVMDELLDERANCPITLRYTFNVAEDFDLTGCSELSLISEYGPEWKLAVNGSEVRHDLLTWWKDTSFKVINIKDLVKNGANTIEFIGSFSQRQKVYDVLFGENVLETERNKLTYDTEIESVYLKGDFGVFCDKGWTEGDRRAIFTDGSFTLGNRPDKLLTGDLVRGGHTFFAGEITLKQTVKVKKSYGKRVRVSFDRPYASCATLFVNGRKVKTFLWSDYTADVTDYVERGDNEIAVRLTISNRNFLGPHHHPHGESYSVTPHSFGPNRNYSPSGWRDRYCFVKTGFGE